MKSNRFSRHGAQPRPHLDTGLRRYDGRLRLWTNPETAFKAEAYFQRRTRSARRNDSRARARKNFFCNFALWRENLRTLVSFASFVVNRSFTVPAATLPVQTPVLRRILLG